MILVEHIGPQPFRIKLWGCPPSLSLPSAMVSAGDDSKKSFKIRLFDAMFDEDSGDEASLRSRDEADKPMIPSPSQSTPDALAALLAPSLTTMEPVAGGMEMVSSRPIANPANAEEGVPAPTKQSVPRFATMGPVAGEAEKTIDNSAASEVRGQESTVRDLKKANSVVASASVRSAELSFLLMGPAERALYQLDRFWWHELVHSGLRQRIASYADVAWKMPERYEDPLTHCMRVIRLLAGNNCSYYVGITESPTRRWESHCRRQYDTMYLLYVAETSRTTAGLEQAILSEVAFRSLLCENNSYGGESASSATPHFLYVVTRESGNMRGHYPEPKRSRMRATVMDDIRGIYR